MNDDTGLPDLMTTPKLILDLDDDPVRLRVSGGTFIHKERISSIPGSRFVGGGADYWTIPRAWAAARVIARLFPNVLEWTERAGEWANSIWNGLVEPSYRLRNSGAEPEWVEAVAKLLPPGVQSKAYQVAGAIYLATARRAMLFDEQGTGKMTQTALTMSLYPDMFPALIICPKGVVYTWKKELAKFGIDADVIDGAASTRRKTFENRTADVLIISYGLMAKHSRIAKYGTIKLSDEHRAHKELNEIAWRTVVADEAHRIKDPNAVQTRACWAVREKADFVWALTGTPVEKNVLDFWPLLHFIDPIEWPAKTKFLDMWVETQPSFYGGGLDIIGLRPSTLNEFREITEWHWRRVLKDDSLPPRAYDMRYTEMAGKHARAYKDMKSQLMAELDSDGSFDTLFAANHMVKTGRLKQMASAQCVIDADDTVRMTEPSWKLDLVEDTMIDYEGKPTIYWFDNRDLLHMFEARLTKREIPFVSIHGDVSALDRQAAIDAFQEGKVDHIILTYGAGSEGTTLTRAPVAFRVQRPWSSIQDQQAPDRNHRIGSEGHDIITYVDFVTLGTVEEDVILMHESKREAQQEILRD